MFSDEDTVVEGGLVLPIVLTACMTIHCIDCLYGNVKVSVCFESVFLVILFDNGGFRLVFLDEESAVECGLILSCGRESAC